MEMVSKYGNFANPGQLSAAPRGMVIPVIVTFFVSLDTPAPHHYAPGNNNRLAN